MKRFLLCASLLSVLLAGFVHRPTPEQIASADYGSYPSDYKEVIQQHFSKRLFDPYIRGTNDCDGRGVVEFSVSAPCEPKLGCYSSEALHVGDRVRVVDVEGENLQVEVI